MELASIPNTLYGRTRETAILLESFDRVSSGQGEILLVPGAPGVGKTALVNEVQEPIQKRNGFFVTGKFDQYRQDIPYFALRQALSELCDKIQENDLEQRTGYREQILQAIGTQGQILVDLVPEFEDFLGVQPPLSEVSPQEARHRFAAVCRNFLSIICLPEHPLVLFIDDWQWADAASFELLKQLQVGTELRYLLVIVSYRSNEVSSGHPLLTTLDALQIHGVPVSTLPVNNLSIADVKAMVTDTLQPVIENMSGLVALIYSKTSGNPFFVWSLLGFLNEIQQLWYDEEHSRWQWHMDSREEAKLPVTVAELFVLKLRRFDQVVRDILCLAACLGNRFYLEPLSLVSGRDADTCRALLQSDELREIVLPPREGATKAQPDDLQGYSFRHDKLQQAAYMLIDPTDLPARRLAIGWLMLDRHVAGNLATSLFEIVNNLNAGYDLLDNRSDQFRVFEINLRAARKSFSDTAYCSALQLYRMAARFFEKPGFALALWKHHHELAMELLRERAAAEFLEGDRRQAEKCIEQAVEHSRTAFEKAQAIQILIVQHTLLARYPEAIAAGRQALAVLDIHLPDDHYEEARDAEISGVRHELKDRSVASLIDLPLMSNPEVLMAAEIMITMGPPCYRAHQRLWSVLVPKVVNLTLHYGNFPQIGYSHTAFGGLLGWVDNDYPTAREFGELATQLMANQFRTAFDQSAFYLMIGSSIRHWFKHLKHGTCDYNDAYEFGLRSGNLQYAAYAFGHNMYCRFYQGAPLPELILETQRSLEFSRTRLNQWAIDLLEGGLLIFQRLAADQPLSPELMACADDEYLCRVESHNNVQVTCIYHVLKTFGLLLAGDYEQAYIASEKAQPLIYTVGTQGLLPWPEHLFARVLIITALYNEASGQQQTDWRCELTALMERLQIWSVNCADNFEHKYLLAQAELARIDAQPATALRLYQAAICAAQQGDFVQWQGFANERMYLFCLAWDLDRFAQACWQQAYGCYDRWGATAKVKSMETEYGADLQQALAKVTDSAQLEDAAASQWSASLLDQQMELLRHYSVQMRQAKHQIELENQAASLTRAIQRLRVETAQRKQLEKELQSKNVELEHYTYTVSHDLKSPLITIQAYASMAQSDLRSGNNELAEKGLRTISDAAIKMGNLLEALLELSRAGKAMASPAAVDMNLLVADSINQMVGVLQQVEMIVQPNLPAAFGDSHRIAGVVQNLIENAIKYMGEQISPRIEVGARREGGETIYFVSDNGAGIEPDSHEAIFDLFKKLNPKSRGTGVGLALVKRIVEGHGGRIWVESQGTGYGSCFLFTLSNG